MSKSISNVIRPISKSLFASNVIKHNAMDDCDGIVEVVRFQVKDKPGFTYGIGLHLE